MNIRLIAVLFFATSTSTSATAVAATPKPASAPAKPAATAPQAAAAKPAPPPGQALPGTPVSLVGRDQVDPSVPEKYRDEARGAQVEGAKLHQEDFAVWVASNALVQAGLRAPGTPTGWIATAKDAGAQTWTVAFTVKGKDKGKQLVYADVGVDLSKPPPKIDFAARGAGRELSADEKILVSARDSISQNKDWLRCSDDYNYSVSFRQGKKGRETVVRAIPARHDQKLYLLGGFHEFTGPDKGGKQKQFHQTNTCLEATLPAHGNGFVVSHLRSKTPTLFHVFMNLSYERPVHVKIDGKTWKVDGGRISLLDKESVKSLKTEAPPAH